MKNHNYSSVVINVILREPATEESRMFTEIFLNSLEILHFPTSPASSLVQNDMNTTNQNSYEKSNVIILTLMILTIIKPF